MSTKQVKNCVGIDVSKKTFDTGVIKQMNKDQMDHQVFNNDRKGIQAFWKYLHKQGIDPLETLFCLEHTGVYCTMLLAFLHDHHCMIWLEMGSVIKKSMGLQRGKNDKVDAQRIALYAYKNREDARPWQPPRPQVTELRQLLGERDRLITCKTILENPINEALECGNRILAKKQSSRCNSIIARLKKQIKLTEKLIEELIASDEELHKKVKLMTTIPGVGKITAYYFICYTQEFSLYNTAKQMACYCGIAPFEHSSGTSIRGRSRVSHMANKRLKSLLHMGALAAVRDDDELKVYYQRKINQGKNPLLVLNAVKNKLVHRIVAVVTRGTPYLPTYNETTLAA